MGITVSELKARLEGYEDDAEVRMAHQPHWPFELSIAGVISSDELASEPERFFIARVGDRPNVLDRWGVLDRQGEREPIDCESQAEAEELAEGMNEDNSDREPNEAPPEGVVWLVEGRQIGYASKRIFDVAR
jgi:hypothetical protein